MKPKTGKIIKCQQCNKKFYIPINRFKTAKFCSPFCRGQSAHRRFKKPCKICGKKFEFIHTRKDRAKYCSRPCYYKAMSLVGSIKVKCKGCRKYFRKPPSRRQIFCNRKCRSKYELSLFSENRLTLRSQFMRRGLLIKCEFCSWNKYPNLLGIHHKDHDNTNNRRRNLVTLCPNCHSEAHNKHVVH